MCMHVNRRECPWKESKREREENAVERISCCRKQKEQKRSGETKQFQNASYHRASTTMHKQMKRKIWETQEEMFLVSLSGFAHRTEEYFLILDFVISRRCSCRGQRGQSVLCDIGIVGYYILYMWEGKCWKNRLLRIEYITSSNNLLITLRKREVKDGGIWGVKIWVSQREKEREEL